MMNLMNLFKRKEKVELVIGLPPIFDWAKKHFPNIDEKTTIFSYGNKIYAPQELPDHLWAHELVHCKRQGYSESGAKKWWDKYVADLDFRYNEEVLAYREQYKFFKERCKDRNKVFNFGRLLANELSSPLYGNLADFKTAHNHITDEKPWL